MNIGANVQENINRSNPKKHKIIYIITKQDLFQVYKADSPFQINYCNPLHQQTKKYKSHDHANNDYAGKNIQKTPQYPFMINSQQTRARRELSQLNKDYPQKSYSEHHTQWWET